MNLTQRQWRVLLALGDTLIPRDDFPSPSEAGLRAFVERNAASWRMVGYDPAPKRPMQPTAAVPLHTVRVADLRAEYDASWLAPEPVAASLRWCWPRRG